MATITAHMLIGHGQQSQGGFEPTHFAFFSEKGRPAWILTPDNLTGPETPARKKIIWIPTKENALDDGLLMIALHVLQDEGLKAMTQSVFKDPDLSGLQMLAYVRSAAREQLYARCRLLDFRSKIVLTLMDGSSLRNQLSVLPEYRLDAEVCLSEYSRFYSHAKGGFVSKGAIPER